MLGSALTLTYIPYWSTTNYEVIAWVKNKKGLEKKYTVNDSTTTVVWLPFVFVPSSQNRAIEFDLHSNMYRNIIQQMYEDGFIEEN